MLTKKSSGGSSGGSGVAPVGQAFYGSGEGSYTWKCPPGVTSVCVVAIGGGAGGQAQTYSTAPYGGGLGWKNDIPVEPGTEYDVQVGVAGDYLGGGIATSSSGGDSYFISTGIVKGGGGQCGTGGDYVGDGGGNGGGSGSGAGGGAGGYTGNGGAAGTPGSGGGGGGGTSYSSTYGYAAGGGVGPYGQGSSGSSPSYCGGEGGSGGESGRGAENPWHSYGCFEPDGGNYGGGSGQGGNSAQAYGTKRGGRGCVRIIWGANRFFPSTGTGDM
jgi:hypothetical protein